MKFPALKEAASALVGLGMLAAGQVGCADTTPAAKTVSDDIGWRQPTSAEQDKIQETIEKDTADRKKSTGRQGQCESMKVLCKDSPSTSTSISVCGVIINMCYRAVEEALQSTAAITAGQKTRGEYFKDSLSIWKTAEIKDRIGEQSSCEEASNACKKAIPRVPEQAICEVVKTGCYKAVEDALKKPCK